jgi:hypothetical protein
MHGGAQKGSCLGGSDGKLRKGGSCLLEGFELKRRRKTTIKEVVEKRGRVRENGGVESARRKKRKGPKCGFNASGTKL